MDAKITKVVEEMAKDMQRLMELILDDNDLSYSNLKKQLTTSVINDGDGVMLQLFANHYIYWVDQGRKPTPYPPLTRWADPVGDIRDWCIRRGIPSDNSTVYAIIQKIHKYGYEGKYFIETFWEEAEQQTYENLQTLFDALIEDLVEWFSK